MHLTLDTTPDPAIRARLFAMLDAFNDAATGRPEPVQHLAIVLRDAAGDVEGGLIGISYYDWLFVDLLYLPPALRGHGMGMQLMRTAEAVAARRGCRGVWLSTYSFPARPFYARLGYQVFATIDDFPPRHAYHWMGRTGLAMRPVPALEIHETRHPEAEAVLGDALRLVNDEAAGPSRERTGPAGGRAFVVLAHDDAGAPCGGLWAVTGRSWLYLDLFVLDAAARRAGLGSRILAMAEAEARARGCVGVWLDTFSFQARPFYESLGFEVFGQIDGPAPAFPRWFMKKGLAV